MLQTLKSWRVDRAMSVCLPTVCLSIYMSVFLFIPLSIHLSVCLSISLSIYQSAYCLSTAWLFVCLSVYLISVYCLSVYCLSVCLYFRLSIRFKKQISKATSARATKFENNMSNCCTHIEFILEVDHARSRLS